VVLPHVKRDAAPPYDVEAADKCRIRGGARMEGDCAGGVVARGLPIVEAGAYTLASGATETVTVAPALT
jgi:hypothetical protein